MLQQLTRTNPYATVRIPQDRSFTFILKTSPASVLLKKAAGKRILAPLYFPEERESVLTNNCHSGSGIETGSGKPNKDKVGQVTAAQVAEIAKIKLPDTNATKLESVIPMIEGTARNMGITVVA